MAENKNCVVRGIPYVSVWDGGVEVETTCTIDLKTGNKVISYSHFCRLFGA